MNAMMASQFFGSDRPAALRGAWGRCRCPLQRRCGNAGTIQSRESPSGYRGDARKGRILFRVQLQMGLRQRFRVAKGGAEKNGATRSCPHGATRRSRSRAISVSAPAVPPSKHLALVDSCGASVSCGAQCKRAFYAYQSDYDARGIHAMASSLAILGLMQDTKGARHGGTDEREFRCAGDQCGRNGAG